MCIRTEVCALALVLMGVPNLWAQSLRDVYKQVNQAVVVVYVVERAPTPQASGRFQTVGGLGSGVLISDNGEVLTAAHVVQAADEILVEFTSGERIPASVTGSEPAADLAMLKLEHRPSMVVPVKLGNSDAVEVGDEIFIIGAPLGVTHSLTAGHISARRRPNRTMGSLWRGEFLQTDAAINQGNSGGPMFNMDGEVIGIVSHIISTTGGSEGLGFVVTSNMARELLITGRAMWSGVEGYDLGEGLGGIFNVPPPGTGVLVQRVARGSVGERLGLQGGMQTATIGAQTLIVGGDIVLSVLGIPAGGPDRLEEMRETLRLLQPGDLITVTVLRAGRQIELSTPFQP